MNKALQVNCPTCQKSVQWDKESSPFRPFCSERCRLIDLGEWAEEQKVIEGEFSPTAIDQLSDEELEAIASKMNDANR